MRDLNGGGPSLGELHARYGGEAGFRAHIARESVARALEASRDADRALAASVASARALGLTWAAVGEVLGVTRQSAYGRFGRSTG